MWRRKSILLISMFVLFILPSSALCQIPDLVPVKRLFPADSGHTRASKARVPLLPVRIDRSSLDSNKAASDGEQTMGGVRVLAPTSTAQWVSFRFSATQWEWRVRQPGDHASKILIGSIRSNGEVSVDFAGFGGLSCSDCLPTRLRTYYAVSCPNSTIDGVTWMNVGELNAHDLLFDETSASWALWQRILVESATPANGYEDRATISIKLQNNGVWLESMTAAEKKR